VLVAVGFVLLTVAVSGSFPDGTAEILALAGLLLVAPALVRWWRRLRGRGGGGPGWPGGPDGGGFGGHHGGGHH
jgi:hypothetical protein